MKRYLLYTIQIAFLSSIATTTSTQSMVHNCLKLKITSKYVYNGIGTITTTKGEKRAFTYYSDGQAISSNNQDNYSCEECFEDFHRWNKSLCCRFSKEKCASCDQISGNCLSCKNASLLLTEKYGCVTETELSLKKKEDREKEIQKKAEEKNKKEEEVAIIVPFDEPKPNSNDMEIEIKSSSASQEEQNGTKNDTLLPNFNNTLEYQRRKYEAARANILNTVLLTIFFTLLVFLFCSLKNMQSTRTRRKKLRKIVAQLKMKRAKHPASKFFQIHEKNSGLDSTQDTSTNPFFDGEPSFSVVSDPKNILDKDQSSEMKFNPFAQDFDIQEEMEEETQETLDPSQESVQDSHSSSVEC